jgi:hypothetical protein
LNENNQLNLKEFIAENKKFYFKMNLFDNVSSNNYNRDRNAVSRSKSPVESTNFNSTLNGVNIKTSHDNLNYKKIKSNKKTISDIPTSNVLTESISLNKKSKDVLSSSPVNNKKISKASEKNKITSSIKLTNNNLTKRSNAINSINFFKKNSTNIIADFKKDLPNYNTKVVYN